MNLNGFHRRFLGNTRSSVWYVDRRMGKNFAVLLDLVKYNFPFVILPDEDHRLFQGRIDSLYSVMKSKTITLVKASNFSNLTLVDIGKKADVVYFLEYGRYPEVVRDFILESIKDIHSPVSLLKLVALDEFPVHFIGTEHDDELHSISETLLFPLGRIPKDY